MWRQQTYLPESSPYPLFFAALFAHLVVMALVVLMPSRTVEREPEQVVAMDLSEMLAPPAPSAAGGGQPPKAEMKPAPPPKPVRIEAQAVKEKTPPPPPKPPEKIEPPKPPKPEKPKPEVVKEPPPPPPKAVVLKPQQAKKVPPPPKQEKKRDDKAIKRDMDKIREQLAKEEQRQKFDEVRRQMVQDEKMRDQRKREKEEADRKAADARAQADQLRSELENEQKQARIIAARQQGLFDSGPKSAQTSAAPSGVNSALLSQYYSRIAGQLESSWKLPDFKDWPPNLLAKVVVTIDRTGKILDVEFEKRSGDDAFDRLVRKTLDDVNPFPPIPPALKRERLEIGFNFKPGSITGQ